MSSRKRKRTRRGSPDYSGGGEGSSSQVSTLGAVLVQAHEATIIRDQPDIVRRLLAHDTGGGKGGLIQWQEGREDKGEVWVDRYDARLLLTSLPSFNARIDVTPPSPSGWSDLPSDSEDTFFLTEEEVEDLRREKRRKTMDAGREERLRALRASDPDPGRDFEDDRARWGGDDEEPDNTQRTLMERTARHFLSSPNPGQLEMRILANHGSDYRFSFLRGRWRNAWRSIKLNAKAEKDEISQKATEAKANTVGGLVAYEDSDDDVDGQGVSAKDDEEFGEKVVDDVEKEARRARAREWSQRRKENKVV